MIEAEQILATIPAGNGNEDLYYKCQLVITGDEEKARRALKSRVRAIRQAEAAAYAEAEQAARAAAKPAPKRGRR